MLVLSAAVTIRNTNGAHIDGQAVAGVSLGSGGHDSTISNTNSASITGPEFGVRLLDGGTVTNDASTISATDTSNGTNGVQVSGASGTVVNTNGASITGGQVGVGLYHGGEVDNGAGSSITGALDSIAIGVNIGPTGAGAYDPPGDGSPGIVRNAGVLVGNVELADGAANTVELTAGGSITGDLAIGTNTASTLTLDGNAGTSQLYSKAVTGTTTFAGSLTKVGNGTWIIDRNDLSNVTDTTIKTGALIVGDDAHPDARLGGTITVAKGATLGGFGTVGGIDLAGTLAPGHSIGTLHVTGDTTFQPGSTWQVEVDPDGHSDQLDVAGKATIQGGDVTMRMSANDLPLGIDYTILQAQGGIQGQFDSVDANVKLTFLSPTLVYQAHSVTLSLERNATTFASVAQTRNQENTAVGIESLGWGSPVYNALVVTNANQARAAFDQLSGEWYANSLTARLHDSRYVRETMNQRLTQAEAGRDDADAARLGHTAGTVWFHAWGQWGDHDGNGNAARMKFNGSGLLVGVDAALDHQARIGGVLGVSQSSTHDNQRASDGRSKATWLGVYGSAVTGPVHWRAGLAYAREHIDSNRHLTVTGLAGSVGADPDGHTQQAWVEAALPFASTHGHAAPFLNLAHVRVSTDGWHEGGSPAALQGRSSDAKATLATLGIRSVWNLGSANHPIRLHGRIGWRQAFAADTPSVRMRLENSTPFTVYGLPLAQHAIALQAGLDFAVSQRVRFDVGYSGQFASHMLDQGARMTLKVGF